MYHPAKYNPVTIVDNISLATDGWEICLMVCLIQRAGKWFSLSLALGTDIVADITDGLPSDMTVQDVNALPTLNHMVGP